MFAVLRICYIANKQLFPVSNEIILLTNYESLTLVKKNQSVRTEKILEIIYLNYIVLDKENLAF